MSERIIPVIMSGGSGTRLWPTSTERLPKQFHNLIGTNSLIQATIARVCGEAGSLSFGAPIVLANIQHETLVDTHLAEIACAPGAIGLEPIGRNTAAAGALAAMLAAEQDEDALVLLLPADHVISQPQRFHEAIARAAPFARERIVTFGVKPDRPATNYGYIRQGASLGEGVFKIAQFQEKPSADVAQTYLDAGDFSWNAGIFLFSPAVLLREFAASAEILTATEASLRNARRDGAKVYFEQSDFERIPKSPLDIAVMEKTSFGAVLPCDFGWADIGSWDEVFRLSPRDGDGNARHGAVITIDADNNLVRSEGPKVCIAGLSDLIVVATPEAVVVVPRARAQDVKLLLEQASQIG